MTTRNAFMEAALDWHRRGFRVIPIVPGGKKSATSWDPWLSNLSEESIAGHWEQHPDHEVGCILVELIAFDADSPGAVATLYEIEKSLEIRCNCITKTKKGEHHVFRPAPGAYIKTATFSTADFPERIDCKTGRSLLVLAPSTDKSVEIDDFDCVKDLVEVDQVFIDAVFRHNGQAPPRRPPVCTVPRPPSAEAQETVLTARRILDQLDPDLGYDEWNEVGMATHYETQGSLQGFELFDGWSSRGAKYPGTAELERRWKSYRTDHPNPVRFGTLLQIAQSHGIDTQLHRAQEARTQGVMDITHPAPLPRADFPDRREINAHQIQLPATVANIDHLLRGYGITATYDVIGKREEIKIPGLSGCPDNASNVALTHCISLATLNGIAVSQVPALISAIADQHQVNPVMGWIQSRPWDGTDRLPDLFATLTTRDGFPIDLKEILIFRWALSAVAAASMASGFRCRGVLVLQGPQSIGKTSWVLRLIPDGALRDRVLLIDHHLDPSNKDSVFTAISKWIVEIGELDSSFRKDIARMKGFLTRDRDTGRRPYDRRDSEYPRRTVFCATVNHDQYLVDESGNTRFWTLPVTKVNYHHSIDMQQVWAQLYAILQHGEEQWHLKPEEEQRLEEWNKNHRSVSAIRDLLETELDFTAAKARWRKMTATETLNMVDMLRPTNAQAREAGAFLREHCGDPTPSQGRQRYLVPPRRISSSQHGDDDDA